MPVPSTLFNSLVNNQAKLQTVHDTLATMERPMSVLQGLVKQDWTDPYQDVPKNLQALADDAVRNVGQAMTALETAVADLQAIYDGYIVPNG